MYIIIHEDAEIKAFKEITKEDISNSNEGYIQIIDITNNRLHVENDTWQDIVFE